MRATWGRTQELFLTIDVDVTAFARVDTRTGVHRVLILVHLDHIIKAIGAVAVATQVVQVEPVRLATLSSHHTDTLDVATGECAGQDLQRTRSQVLVGTVQSLLLPWHKEIYQTQTSIGVNCHVNGGLFQRCRRRAAVDGNGAELGGVSVASGVEQRTCIVGSETTTGHPDTTALDIDGDTVTFGSKTLDVGTAGLVESHDPTCEVVLNTVRSKPSVDVVANVQQSRSLMMNTAVEGANRVVSRYGALEIDGEVGLLAEVIDIQGMEVVTAGRFSLSNAGQGLVDVRLGSEVESVGRGINYTGGGDTDVRFDIIAAIQVGRQEGNGEAAGSDDAARLCINFVDIILCSRDVDVLRAVAVGRINEWLRKDLLCDAAIFAGQRCAEELPELGAPHDGGVHVVVSSRCDVVLDHYSRFS